MKAGLHIFRESAEAFMLSPNKLDVFQNYLQPAAQRYTEALFTGTVLKDMDSMFRRSGVCPGLGAVSPRAAAAC